MSLRSYVLTGELGTKLQFPIARTEDILSGTWEMAFSTISFQYLETRTPVLLRITCNLVMGHSVNSQGELTSEEATLNILMVNPTLGSRGIVGFRQRDFYEINRAQRDMVITIAGLQEETLPRALVFLHVLLRRIR